MAETMVAAIMEVVAATTAPIVKIERAIDRIVVAVAVAISVIAGFHHAGGQDNTDADQESVILPRFIAASILTKLVDRARPHRRRPPGSAQRGQSPFADASDRRAQRCQWR